MTKEEFKQDRETIETMVESMRADMSLTNAVALYTEFARISLDRWPAALDEIARLRERVAELEKEKFRMRQQGFEIKTIKCGACKTDIGIHSQAFPQPDGSDMCLACENSRPL